MPPERRAARALQIFVGVAISVLLVWFAFRKQHLATIWADIRTVHVGTLLLAIFFATIAFPLRTPRWRLLLRRLDDRPIPLQPLWRAIAIGFAANNVLPLRAGEVLRVGAVSRLADVPFAAALSSVAVERVLDALTVIALIGIGLLTAHLPPGVRIGGVPVAVVATRTGIVCLVALVVALLASWRRTTALALLDRILPSGPFSQRVVAFVDHLLRGLGAMRDPRRAIPIIAWSATIWLVNAFAYYLAFRAFGFAVPFSGALVVQGVLMIGIAVPSGPGYVGIFEYIIPAALSLYNIDPDAALACAVTYHVTTFIPITLLGAVAAVRSGAHFRTPSQPA